MIQIDEDAILRMIRDRIVVGFNPQLIVLFGSRARGDAAPDSDLDLLVILDEVPDRRRLAVEIRRVLADLPVSKDIFVATPDEFARAAGRSGSVLESAAREGRTIFERN